MIKQNKYMIILTIMISLSILYACSNDKSEVIYSNDNAESGAVTSEHRKETAEAVSETLTTGEVYVQVCGAVRTPGVYKVSSTLRVFQVIEAAGGVTEQADINAVNMARPVSDEMYIYIPVAGEVQENGLPASELETFSEISNKKVNINTATKEELMTLKGIGEAKADAIIIYREETGGFTDISQIMNISGIKEAAFNKIKDNIVIE